MSGWLNRPKITPLQMLLYTGSVFYFLFISTDFFQSLNDFVKFIIFVGVVLLGYLAGYSAIDSKKLGLQIYKILRSPNHDLPEKYEQVFSVIDDILFHVQKELKQHTKKKVKKKDGR
jgi:hypothetical protein